MRVDDLKRNSCWTQRSGEKLVLTDVYGVRVHVFQKRTLRNSFAHVKNPIARETAEGTFRTATIPQTALTTIRLILPMAIYSATTCARWTNDLFPTLHCSVSVIKTPGIAWKYSAFIIYRIEDEKKKFSLIYFFCYYYYSYYFGRGGGDRAATRTSLVAVKLPTSTFVIYYARQTNNERWKLWCLVINRLFYCRYRVLKRESYWLLIHLRVSLIFFPPYQRYHINAWKIPAPVLTQKYTTNRTPWFRECFKHATGAT